MVSLPKWMEYGLVLMAAWMVAGFWVEAPILQHDLVVPTEESDVKELVKEDGKLKKVALFGQPVREEKVARVMPSQPAKVSQLHIKLIGTVVAGNKSAALVSLGGKKEQKVFFLGDVIQPNVELVEVLSAAIVVDNAGKRERISLENTEVIGRAFPGQGGAYPMTKANPQAVKPRNVSRRVNKVKLQKQLRNFSALLSQARVSPHFTNKKADGFTINEIVKGSLYEEIGLQNGDVIQKVNGESVTSAEQAMRMYRELQNATFIDVEISRGGLVQQVNYTIQ